MITSDVAFTDAVKRAQVERGSRKAYAKMEARGGWEDRVTTHLREFLAARDSLYLGTASAEGQPYVQHRGGPKGFVKVLDEKTLAMADYAGNAQYISLGNLSENPKACLFLMDYPNQHRIKVWGRAEFIEGDQELVERVRDPEYSARVHRVLVFHIEAWDVNCTQHITPRFTQTDLRPMVERLEGRIARLEAQLREAGMEREEEHEQV